ncbi:MAG: hypothetical protein RL033_2352 [Pseudomonadota bacterium]
MHLLPRPCSSALVSLCGALLWLSCRSEAPDASADEPSAGVPPAQVSAPAQPAPGSSGSEPPAALGPASDSPGNGSPGNGGEQLVPTELVPVAPTGSNGAGSGAAGSGAAAPAAMAGAAGASSGAAPPAAATGPLTLYLAGDSTVQTYANTASERDQAGWGQMLGAHVAAGVTVDNRSIGGRTARRFIDEGRLDEIFAELLPDDYLLVQFGTNDGNRTATYQLGDEAIPYFLDPATDFKSYLQQYIDGARERGALPVLVTPPPRNSAYCTGGNGTGGHAQAMRELGRAQNVPVVDLNARSVAYLMAICPAPTPEDFFLLRADGTIDGTHFQENGARILANLVAGGLREVVPALAPRID